MVAVIAENEAEACDATTAILTENMNIHIEQSSLYDWQYVSDQIELCEKPAEFVEGDIFKLVPMTLDEYRKKVEEKIFEHFLITVDDCTDNEAIEQAWKNNETFEEFIDFIGSKHNLDDYVKEPWLK